jgi:DNA invertase Pin-like site-specific DNA recombinase
MEQVIGYARISSTAVKKGQVRIEGENNSIEVQVKKITEYCKFKGLNLVEILIDEDISGGKEFSKRDGGIKAQQYFDKGIKTIVAVKIDRLFRNVKDSLITIDDWSSAEIDLHIVDMQGSSFSTKTAIGRLMFTTVVSFSEYERAVTGERTKAILSNKKSENKVYCHSLLGFDKVNGQLVKNEEEYKAIEFINDLKDEFSPAAIAEKLNNSKFRAKKGGIFYPSTIQSILKNPIYR